MKRFYQVLSHTIIVLIICLSFTYAIMEDGLIAPGHEDISTLTYKELLQLQADISSDIQAYHTPTDTQKNKVLTATQNVTQQYYSKKNIEITSWAWYDSEYTYTRDWDFYTLKTHLNYKDSNKKNKKVIIYAEVFSQDGRYNVSYLKTDDTIIIDMRSEYSDTLWLTEPNARINAVTKINLATYTVQQLKALNDKAQKEIEKNHTVSKNETSIILALAKSELEQYCLKKKIEIKSYAWYDREYTYTRDWDYYWLETHVDYKASTSSSQKTDKLYSEVCKINGVYELIYLKMGSTIIKDRRNELVSLKENGIPRYNWAEDTTTKGTNIIDGSLSPLSDMTPQVIYVTPEPGAIMTPEIVYVTPEPMPIVTPETIYITPIPKAGVFNVNLEDLTDEQLEEAAEAIRAEQRARNKTDKSSNPSPKTTSTPKLASTPKQIAILAKDSGDSGAYLENLIGKELFDAVIKEEKYNRILSGGSDEWYDYATDVNKMSFEINCEGEYGKPLVISVMDILNTGKKELFFKVLENIFTGEDLKTANRWVKANLGKEAETKIGDANIVLRLTVSKYPVMFILLDDYLAWI